MVKKKGFCKKCNKFKEIHTKDGWCNWCYRKTRWNRKLIICKRCERSISMHAKGLCAGCYNSVFHIEKVKEHNTRKYHNVDMETYNKTTKKCIICGFDKIVDLHHLDFNHQNNSENNLIGLCPNHHKLIHDRRFRKEIFKILREKGFKVQEKYKDDEFYKKDLTGTIHKNKLQ